MKELKTHGLKCCEDMRPGRTRLYDVKSARRPGRRTKLCVSTHAANCSNFQMNGGARRDRTDDLLLAKQALSQLSYGPVELRRRMRWWAWVDSNYRPHAYQACALTT